MTAISVIGFATALVVVAGPLALWLARRQPAGWAVPGHRRAGHACQLNPLRICCSAALAALWQSAFSFSGWLLGPVHGAPANRHPLAWPLAMMVCLLLVFQLLLRTSIRFY
ncbi:MAG TPA: hypothetical protein VGD52_14875 [Pseudoduganella sp.]